eukprot:7888825-Pyramimonas_sp.AAC.1
MTARIATHGGILGAHGRVSPHVAFARLAGAAREFGGHFTSDLLRSSRGRCSEGLPHALDIGPPVIIKFVVQG